MINSVQKGKVLPSITFKPSKSTVVNQCYHIPPAVKRFKVRQYIIDYQYSQIVVRGGKGGKDRATYFTRDAGSTMAAYLRIHPRTRGQKIFLAEKVTYKGKPLSVRGIQKRMEYYSKKSDFRSPVIS